MELAREVLRRQQSLLPELHPQLAATMDVLATCSAHQRRWADAIQSMRRAMPVLQRQFGTDSVEVAHERCKLAQLQRCAGLGQHNQSKHQLAGSPFCWFFFFFTLSANVFRVYVCLFVLFAVI